MKKFHFSLERLLKLKEHIEEEWEIKLGEATGRCVRIRKGIEERRGNHVRTLQDRGGLSHQDLMASELYMGRMRQEVVELEKELEEAEEERLNVQGFFLEASRERKVLQKLKEKKEAIHKQDQLKKDFDVLDDINSGAAARRQAHDSGDGNF